MPRIGIERLREIVVEDADGIAARLDPEIERSIDDYVDPWIEADRPATANQFSSRIAVTP